MIDKLVLRCDFLKQWFPAQNCFDFPTFKIHELGIPLDVSLDADGEIMNVRHPWERIPSSFEGMAFKVFDTRYKGGKDGKNEAFFIEIKASPAKLMQGHNVFGSVDFCDCALRLIVLLCSKYPVLASKLDFSSWSLVQIDVTYASRAKNDKEAKRFINALGKVSSGQTKSQTGYDGTAYFGKKNSRLKKVKVYAKHPEVLATIKKNGKKKDVFEYSEQLLEFSKGMIRWELSLYHRYFKRAGIPCELSEIIYQDCFFSPQMLRAFWRNGLSQLFKALEGQEMKVVDNNAVLEALRAKFSKISAKTGKVSTIAPDGAFRTYRDICRDGWKNVRDLLPIRTFNHHVKMLCECGLSRAALQNMNGLDDGSKIVSFAEFMQVDFDAQYPDWYEPEPPIYTREMFLNEDGEFDFAEGLKKLISNNLSS